jgi:chaperonin GroES
VGFEYEPLGDRLIAEVIPEAEVSAGGVHLPEQARERDPKGRVVAVGPGARDSNGVVHALELQVGDEIVYHRHGGTPLKAGDGEAEYVVLREVDVFARRNS